MVLRAFVLGKAIGILHFSLEGVKHVFSLLTLYIKFLFIPFPLGFKYEMPHVDTISVIFSCIILVIIVYFSIKNHNLLFSFLWLFICLIPPLMLAFYSRPIFADRFLYLPSVGFVVFLTGLISFSIRKDFKKVLVFTIFIIIVYAGITAVANRNWKNDEIVYSIAIKNSPHYRGAYTGLAGYYERNGYYEKALKIYFEALNNVQEKEKSFIYDGIAFLYAKTGFSEKSISYYQKELEINPKSSSAYVGLGNNYWFKKDYENALRFYTMAWSLDSKNYEACYNLAFLYEFLGKTDKAIYYYRIFIDTAPQHKYGENVKRAKKFVELFSRSP